MRIKALMILIIVVSFVFIHSVSTTEEVVDITPALEYLKNYKFGMEVAPLNPIVEAIKTTKNNPAKQEELSNRLMEIFTQSTIDGKRFIARQLVVIGTPSIVPKLAPYLENEETIDLACRVLEQIPGKEATKVLMNALDKPIADSLKVAIINSLGRRRDEISIGTLQKYLDSPVKEISNSALYALSEMPGSKSAEILWNWSKEKLDSGDKRIVESLLKVADNASKVEEGKRLATSILEAIYESPKTSSVCKINALQGLITLKGKDLLPLLERNILSDDKILSYASVDLLKNTVVSDEDVARVISSLLPKVSSPLQLALLEVVTARNLRSCLPQVIELLNSPTQEVKIAVIGTISKIGDVKSANILLGLALSDNKEISESAEDALLKISSDGITEFLMEKAKNGNEVERKLSVRLLGERREIQSKSLLLDFVKNGDKVILEEALDSLSVIGDPNDLEIIFGKLIEDVENASKYIPTAISILNRVEDEAKRVGYVTERLNKSKDLEERKVYIELLGNLKTTEGTQILVGLIDKEKDLLPVILKALGNSENLEVLKVLISRLPEFKSDDVRYSAVSSCFNILRSNVPLTEAERCAYYVNLWKYVDGKPILQKNILGNISKINRIEALNFVEGIKPSDDIKNDWQMARVTLAKNLCFSCPERCVPILESSLDFLRDKQKEEVLATLEGVKNKNNYLCAWSVSGPYQNDDYSAERLFKEVSLPPETDPSSVKDWRILPMKVREDKLIYGDLFEQLGGGVECVAYVACKISCEAPSKATLLLGSNDGIKVWLNGKLVHSSPNGRVMTPDEDKVELELGKDNVLLMGIYNQGGAWEFTAKLEGLDLSKIKIEPY